MRRLLVLLLVLVAIPALAEEFKGKVVGVTDGDTICGNLPPRYLRRADARMVIRKIVGAI